MQRRDILKRAGAATAVGLLGGCLSDNSGSPGGSGSDDKTTTTTTTTSSTTTEPTTKTGAPNSTTSANASVEKRSIKLLDAGCMNGKSSNSASVSFERAKKRVVVNGTIIGNNPCLKPVLQEVKTDSKPGHLSVTIGTKKKDESDSDMGCAQCIAEFKYRATLTFEDSAPDSVKVFYKSDGKKKVITATDSESSTATAEN